MFIFSSVESPSMHSLKKNILFYNDEFLFMFAYHSNFLCCINLKCFYCFSPPGIGGGPMHQAGLVHCGPQPHPGPQNHPGSHMLQHNQQMASMPILPEDQIQMRTPDQMNNIQINNPGQVLQSNVQPSPSPPTQVSISKKLFINCFAP